MTKIFRKKISEVLRIAISQNACGKTSLVESAFNKIAGIDSGPLANLTEERFSPRRFSYNYIKIYIVHKGLI